MWRAERWTCLQPGMCVGWGCLFLRPVFLSTGFSWIVLRLSRSSSTLPGISGAFSLCSRKEYKTTALVLKQTTGRNVLARSDPSTQRAGARGGGSGLCWSWCPSCLSVMQCCISLVEGENAVTSGNDVILIAFVCCTAVQTLKIYIQPSDPAFFSLYTFTYSWALRHIDLIPSVF